MEWMLSRIKGKKGKGNVGFDREGLGITADHNVRKLG